MKKCTLPIVLLLLSMAFQGCSNPDPDQPAVGSISVKPKSDDDGIRLPQKSARAASKRG